MASWSPFCSSNPIMKDLFFVPNLRKAQSLITWSLGLSRRNVVRQLKSLSSLWSSQKQNKFRHSLCERVMDIYWQFTEDIRDDCKPRQASGWPCAHAENAATWHGSTDNVRFGQSERTRTTSSPRLPQQLAFPLCRFPDIVGVDIHVLGSIWERNRICLRYYLCPSRIYVLFHSIGCSYSTA